MVAFYFLRNKYLYKINILDTECVSRTGRHLQAPRWAFCLSRFYILSHIKRLSAQFESHDIHAFE